MNSLYFNALNLFTLINYPSTRRPNLQFCKRISSTFFSLQPDCCVYVVASYLHRSCCSLCPTTTTLIRQAGLASVQALLQSSTIHPHADLPKAATLGKRKSSDEHSRPDKKRIMTVCEHIFPNIPLAINFVSYAPSSFIGNDYIFAGLQTGG